jgi:hypothetical protein
VLRARAASRAHRSDDGIARGLTGSVGAQNGKELTDGYVVAGHSLRGAALAGAPGFTAVAVLTRSRSASAPTPRSSARARGGRLAVIEPRRSIYDVMPLEQRIGNEYSADRLRTAAAAAALVPAVRASRVDPMTALREE